jgi:hypothetical protein
MMDIKNMTVRQLKALLKQLSVVSLGVNDIMLKHEIEDELNERKGFNND